MDNIFEIAELLNSQMQKKSNNPNVKFFYQDDQWYYMSEDEEVYVSKESDIIDEVNEQWLEFLSDQEDKGVHLGLGSIIDKYTDYVEGVIEKELIGYIQDETLAYEYKNYISDYFSDEKSRLELMSNFN